jgi:hypothetical protein
LITGPFQRNIRVGYRANVGESWADRILVALRGAPDGLDDDVLAFRLNASQRQTINQVCRRLETAGLLARHRGREGKIVNVLLRDRGAVAPTPAESAPQLLTEDEVKAAVKMHLEAKGYAVHVAWGRTQGVDIEAHKDAQHLYLEAKGEPSNRPPQVNNFLGGWVNWFNVFAIRRPSMGSPFRITLSIEDWSSVSAARLAATHLERLLRQQEGPNQCVGGQQRHMIEPHVAPFARVSTQVKRGQREGSRARPTVGRPGPPLASGPTHVCRASDDNAPAQCHQVSQQLGPQGVDSSEAREMSKIALLLTLK